MDKKQEKNDIQAETKITPQNRYNAKVYDKLEFKVEFRECKEIVQAFKDKCKTDGVSQML